MKRAGQRGRETTRLTDEIRPLPLTHLRTRTLPVTRASILAQAGLLEPLNAAEFAPYGLTGANFTPAAWDMAHTNGKLYAIPLDTHPLVMYYNTDICKKAGLLGKDGSLKNLDDPAALTGALTAAKKVTGAYGGVVSINSDTASQWRFFSSLMTTPPLVAIALMLAVFADRLRRGRWFFRLAFFAPYVVPSAAMALIWTWLYTPGIGLWDKWLSAIGISDPPNWLGDPSWAMASVALATVWWTLGFNFVLYLAGLQEIPRTLYEAAEVDGASRWHQLRHITIPLLKRTTVLVLVLQIIASLKIFDQIFLMTAGGPNYSTRPLLEYVYDIGFTDFRTGYAAAASMLYFLVILAVSLVWFFVNRRQQKEA